MSDLYETIIESPILFHQDKHGYRRNAVSYRGHKMYPSTAHRMKELRPSVEEMNKRGMTLRKAAQKLGYTRQTFRKYLRIWGIRWLTTERFTRKTIDKTGWREAILAGAQKGWTLQRIGESLDTDLANIHRYCKRHDIAWKAIRKNHEKENR
jgi:hypothetical protein